MHCDTNTTLVCSWDTFRPSGCLRLISLLNAAISIIIRFVRRLREKEYDTMSLSLNDDVIKWKHFPRY